MKSGPEAGSARAAGIPASSQLSPSNRRNLFSCSPVAGMDLHFPRLTPTPVPLPAAKTTETTEGQGLIESL